MRNSDASVSISMKRLIFDNTFTFFAILLIFLLFIFFTLWNAQTSEVSAKDDETRATALGADLLLLAQCVTVFLTKIFGKLKVKFHVYMCAVPQTCKSDKKYCSQHEANTGFFHSRVYIQSIIASNRKPHTRSLRAAHALSCSIP